MTMPVRANFLLVLCAAFLAARVPAQSTPNSRAAYTANTAQRGIELAEKGRCEEALASLKKLNFAQVGKELRYHAQMAIARCAMSLSDDQTTVNALFALRRDFPNDPQVLYITTHFLSEMARRVSLELATVAPTSYQALELEAESSESQGNFDRAEFIYKKILADNPKVPGVHYRLGRVALSRPDSPENDEEAKKQFQLELTIDPLNAAAEFWLGELERRSDRTGEAIPHFIKAYTLDSGFAEAYMALGMTYLSTQRPEDAIAPLERYVKLVPGDPAGHYQLSIAYGRTGRPADQQRELRVQQELNERRESVRGPVQNSVPPQ